MKPYYEHAGIEIYHGNCLDVLPGLTWDHCIADPPYEAASHTKQRRVGAFGGELVMRHIPFAPITEELRSSVATLLGPTPRWVLAFCEVEGSHLWRAAFEAAGLAYRRTCLWIKPGSKPQFSGDRPGMGYEAFVVMHADKASTWNGGGRNGVFTFTQHDDDAPRPNPHPTPKPLKLMTSLVSLFTDPGETIVDPFMGSGTTLRAAKDLGRRAIGIEMNEKYCELAARRMSQEVMQFGEATP